jgi:signal transduction histidine kinase
VRDKPNSEARILVVDDELGMREGCRRALSSSGYRVDTADSLGAGLERIRDNGYDLYLLDVMLPDGSGLDLMESILKQDPQAICIIITGFGSIEMAATAVRRGAYYFLAKPFTSDELAVSVAKGLEQKRLKQVELQAGELARAKEELERLDEEKSRLLLKVAHELRAPVAAVQSYVNLLLAGYMSEQEIKPTLSRIQDRLQEVLDLTVDLLELANLKQAKNQASAGASPQDAAQVLEEVLDLFQEQTRDKQQSLQVEIVDRPSVTAHRDHLRQVWTNLVSNAIKYTPVGGHIDVRLQVDGSDLLGSVQDSGIGIAERDLDNLFREFYRTDEAKASGEIGTGLGLSIVKQIVESYEGDITVASKPGQGSRFTFRLPLNPPPRKPAEPIEAPLRPKEESSPPPTEAQPRPPRFSLGEGSPH